MRDIWANERWKREENSRQDVLPAFQSYHRICPMCAGEGGGLVSSFSRLDPPYWDDCPVCAGIGRVDQQGWEMAIASIKYEKEADDAQAAHWEREYEATLLEAVDG